MPWLAPTGMPGQVPMRESHAVLARLRALQVAGVAPDARSAFGQHPHRLAYRHPRRARGARAPAFDRVIDGADAGGEEEVHRRLQCRRGVEDHRFRHHERMGVHLLDVPLQGR